MNDNTEIKQKILGTADQMFNEFGLAKVTMEEIAGELGISKKTLYKHFSNKVHLLKELVHEKKCAINGKIGQIVDDPHLPFIDKLKELLSYIASVSAAMNQRLEHDIMRLHPDIWTDIKEFRKQNAISRVAKFISEGVEQGIIRNDINLDLITYIYIGAMHSIETPAAFEKINLSISKLHSEALKVVYEGILSARGREEFISSNILTTPKENI